MVLDHAWRNVPILWRNLGLNNIKYGSDVQITSGLLNSDGSPFTFCHQVAFGDQTSKVFRQHYVTGGEKENYK